jgi:hypothetical protein
MKKKYETPKGKPATPESASLVAGGIDPIKRRSDNPVRGMKSKNPMKRTNKSKGA